MELHNQAFATLGAAERQAVREEAEECFISYAFLRQSGVQHGTLKVDLQNDFTTGDNRYPKNRQQTLKPYRQVQQVSYAQDDSIC
jgi:hypothetical protein